MFVTLFMTVVLFNFAYAAPTADNVDICKQAPLIQGGTDHCRGFFQKYTYNATVGECQIIIYGGCDGSENLFNSIQECERTCGLKKNSTRTGIDIATDENDKVRNKICLQRKMRGYCRAIIQSFYYNAKLKKCRPFRYGGCGGNSNKFATLQECQSVCEI